MIRIFCLICMLCLTIFCESVAAQTRIDFSNFAVGTTFPSSTIPKTITADGVDIALSKYNGTISANGRIVDTLLFGSPDSGLFLGANLRAEIFLLSPAEDGFFSFRNQGGTNLLEVNGQTLNFTDPSLSGSANGTVGGVTVHSAAVSGFFRSVKLDGAISSLAFIGQELTIDGVGLYLVPEPSSVLLAITAAAAVPTRRRKSVPQEQLWDAIYHLGAEGLTANNIPPEVIAKLVEFKMVELNAVGLPQLTPYGAKCFAVLETGNGVVPELNDMAAMEDQQRPGNGETG